MKKILLLLFLFYFDCVVRSENHSFNSIEISNLKKDRTKKKSLEFEILTINESKLDSIDISDLKNDSTKNDCLKLDIVTINESKLDSIVSRITKKVADKSSIALYITLMKYEEDLYMEIVCDYENLYLFVNRVKSTYGLLKYKDMNIYILLYPSPYTPSDCDLNCLFNKTNNNTVIYKKDPYGKGYYLNSENPIWLFKYRNKSFILIRSMGGSSYSSLF